MSLLKLDINGFLANQEAGTSKFTPPCVYQSFLSLPVNQNNEAASDGTKKVMDYADLYFVILSRYMKPILRSLFFILVANFIQPRIFCLLRSCQCQREWV